MNLDVAFELVSAFIQIGVIASLVFRKIYKTLPLLSSYLVWALLAQGLSLILPRFANVNFERAFLTISTIDAAFMFCVLVELSMSVLKPIRSSLPRWTFILVGGFFAAAFVLVWSFAKPPDLGRWGPVTQHIIHIDITTSVLQILFFLALAGFSQLLSISWRDRELQVATALGFYALVGLSVTLMHMNQGAGNADQYHRLDQIVTGSYIASMVYLIVSFAQKVPERREFTPQMESFLLALAGQARTTRMAMTNSSEFKKGKLRD
jgi:hypothetical protein